MDRRLLGVCFIVDEMYFPFTEPRPHSPPGPSIQEQTKEERNVTNHPRSTRRRFSQTLTAHRESEPRSGTERRRDKDSDPTHRPRLPDLRRGRGPRDRDHSPSTDTQLVRRGRRLGVGLCMSLQGPLRPSQGQRPGRKTPDT